MPRHRTRLALSRAAIHRPDDEYGVVDLGNPTRCQRGLAVSITSSQHTETRRRGHMSRVVTRGPPSSWLLATNGLLWVCRHGILWLKSMCLHGFVAHRNVGTWKVDAKHGRYSITILKGKMSVPVQGSWGKPMRDTVRNKER